MGWLETRSPQELSVYRQVAGIGHNLIAEFFSNRVITPDITTTEDVEWWIRDRVTGLGLEVWFQPSISVQRRGKEAAGIPGIPRSSAGATSSTATSGSATWGCAPTCSSTPMS